MQNKNLYKTTRIWLWEGGLYSRPAVKPENLHLHLVLNVEYFCVPACPRVWNNYQLLQFIKEAREGLLENMRKMKSPRMIVVSEVTTTH